METNNQNKATYKQKLFAKAIAKELSIKDFDIKNYDTKEKCFAFIKEHIDEFHKVKTERANGGNANKDSKAPAPVNDLPF